LLAAAIVYKDVDKYDNFADYLSDMLDYVKAGYIEYG
jgi:hypothetical protein